MFLRFCHDLDGYFPRAYDDPVNVWEDESISFNPLENDYFAGDNASMLGFSQVRNECFISSVLQIVKSFDSSKIFVFKLLFSIGFGMLARSWFSSERWKPP